MLPTECPPELRELQSWVRWLVTDPRGVEAALADRPSDLPRHREPRPRCLARIASVGVRNRIDRLAVYAEGYFARLEDATASDFPLLRLTLGSKDFQDLLRRYLHHYPSRSPTVTEVGRQLECFLRSAGYRADLPHLADIASLEWAVVECFYAPDSTFFDPSQLAGLGEEHWPGLRFVLDPSVRFLETEWAVRALWIEEKAVDLPVRGRERLLVHRIGQKVRVTPLEPFQWACLKSLASGHSLAECCDELATLFGTEEPFQHLTVSFGDWVAMGIISGVRQESSLDSASGADGIVGPFRS